MSNEQATHAMVRDGARVRRLLLRAIQGPDTGFEVFVEGDRAVALGSSSDNEITLRDLTVSRYHLELSAEDSGLRIKDLGSLNGTFVQGIRVEAGIAPPGARLQVGGTIFSIEDAGDTTGTRRRAEPASKLPGFVAESPAMRRIARTLRKLGPTSVSVLLQGETGTGKEVVARAIHQQSQRADAPFVVVDCGSLPANLIASELFGHERGAFTGANRRHIGAFERAQGGTLFLDEIGELPVEVQPALLGVLERRCFRRVGGETELASDVRVVSATHRDLRAAANADTFRADLYFRLAVARVVIPPLRERVEDIAPLARHFASELSGTQDALPLDARFIESLASHHWGGNVRELRNLVESALALGTWGSEQAQEVASPATPTREQRAYRAARAEAILQFERDYLTRLIEDCGGNASEAARRAKMDRPYLLTLLRRHGLR